jgi:ATP-binding cassette subfamily D (ALD) protein 3
VRNSSLLINLAKAIGRLVVSYKEVQSLAGYTTLIHEMDEVLTDLSDGKYKRVMVAQ